MCVENLNSSEATVVYFKHGNTAENSSARLYSRTDSSYRCMGTSMETSGGDTGLALFWNISTKEFMVMRSTNPFDGSPKISYHTSAGYFASTAWTLLFNGAVYFEESGATGFFFAGTGKDFYQQTYSQNVGFIAKTSESGVGVSNCITTTYSSTALVTVTYDVVIFNDEEATDVTDVSWTHFLPAYFASWEALDFSLIPHVCTHEIIATIYDDFSSLEGTTGSYSLAAFT